MYDHEQPFTEGKLKVSEIHTLHYEISGNEKGTPVIFLHGGPGAGFFPRERRFFNPSKYRVIMLDQRGSGKSTPNACLEDNTTWDLVKDVERLREHLGIEKWHVFGGSWGSTLSLAYAQTHPDRVKTLVLRGIFAARKSELEWSYTDGVSHIFPDAWDEFIAPIPEEERGDLLNAYHRQLNSSDDKVRERATRAWTIWELTTSKLYIDPEELAKADKDEYSNAIARIESHYFVNSCFLREGQLLERQEIDKIRHIPAVIVQGRYDVICPAATAWELKRVWEEAELVIVPDAGHSSGEPGTEKALVQATDKFAELYP